MNCGGELELAFEAARAINYGSGCYVPYKAPKRETREFNKEQLDVCDTCGGRARQEFLTVKRPGAPVVFRRQKTCLQSPPCQVTVHDSHTPTESEKRGVVRLSELPLCACGCGNRVKSEGRKLASRRCIGAYNASSESRVTEVRADQVLENCVKLAKQIPRSQRDNFFRKVVELVNMTEDLCR